MKVHSKKIWSKLTNFSASKINVRSQLQTNDMTPLWLSKWYPPSFFSLSSPNIWESEGDKSEQ